MRTIYNQEVPVTAMSSTIRSDLMVSLIEWRILVRRVLRRSRIRGSTWILWRRWVVRSWWMRRGGREVPGRGSWIPGTGWVVRHWISKVVEQGGIVADTENCRKWKLVYLSFHSSFPLASLDACSSMLMMLQTSCCVSSNAFYFWIFFSYPRKTWQKYNKEIVYNMWDVTPSYDSPVYLWWFKICWRLHLLMPPLLADQAHRFFKSLLVL